MASFEGILRNFRFMAVQTTKQLESTRRLLGSPDPRLVDSIRKSDDYIDTQKSMIENECFKFIRGNPEADERMVDTVRALSIITANLERIADLSVNVARQTQYLGDPALLATFNYGAYFESLFEGVALIAEALQQRDSSLALRICHAEHVTDRLYRADFEEVIAALRSSREPERLITVLFILHYLERMGDSLLNIGEAVLFAVLGERLKVHQYRMLDQAVAATAESEPSLDKMELGSIWGTRSGVRVGTVGSPQGAESLRKVLFKEGQPDKLQAEKESLQRWSQVAPGLVPAVVEFEQREAGAALLLQYLDGVTLQEIILNGDPEPVRRAQDCVEQTLDRLWSATRKPDLVNGRYIRQLAARLDDVYRMHPWFRCGGGCIGSRPIPAFHKLLEQAAELDTALNAPFSVLTHGDFNLDNIIYNRDADSLHFVDVHRSCDMDYVQDVSVFLVSCFRLPVFVRNVRRNIEDVACRFLAFARRFARDAGDVTFEARLALGLIRSFATSTRFELNRVFARAMHERAVWLLTCVLSHRGRSWADFRVPDRVLVY